MKKAVIYTVAFLAIQFVASALVQGAYWLIEGKAVATTATMLIVTMALFSAAVVAVFIGAKWADVSPRYLRSRPWGVFFWCAVAATGAIIPSEWLQEQMPELPNLMELQFDMIMKDRWGYVVIGLLAPLAEELVFRGAVLRALLSWHPSHWVGIGVSALFFALVHGNPAQMPHAFLIGLLLGWMYYRTASILPGVVYHWVNNSIAYVLYNLYPDPSVQLVDIFGSQRTAMGAVFFSLLILAPSVYQLHLRMRKAKSEAGE